MRSPFAAAAEAANGTSPKEAAANRTAAKSALQFAGAAKGHLAALQREDSHTLPWQEAMRAQRTFAQKKAAAEADETADAAGTAAAKAADAATTAAADPRVPGVTRWMLRVAQTSGAAAAPAAAISPAARSR